MFVMSGANKTVISNPVSDELTVTSAWKEWRSESSRCLLECDGDVRGQERKWSLKDWLFWLFGLIWRNGR